MPSENVQLIRRLNDDFNRRDFEALFRVADPDVRLDEWPDAPGAQSYRGRDGIRRAFQKWFETWDWMHSEIKDIEEAGERVLVALAQRARGSASGVEVSITSWNIYEFRGGKVLRLQMFIDRGHAMEEWHASGLEGAKTTGEETA